MTRQEYENATVEERAAMPACCGHVCLKYDNAGAEECQKKLKSTDNEYFSWNELCGYQYP
jgi:hypothetical protein